MKRLDSFDDLSRVKKQSDKSVEKFGTPPKCGNTLRFNNCGPTPFDIDDEKADENLEYIGKFTKFATSN